MEPKEQVIIAKKPLLTTRQIAMAATLGGLCFAWRALGLVIPMPVPGYVIDIREPIYLFSAFMYGPVVSVIVSILGGLPTPFPPSVWIGNLIGAPLAAYAWKNLRLWKAPWKVKVPLVYVVYALWMIIFLFSLMWCSANIMHYWPFWPTFVFALTGGPFLIWWLAGATMVLVLLRASSPDGITREPDWTWPFSGGKANG
jgi:hypothetical protein